MFVLFPSSKAHRPQWVDGGIGFGRQTPVHIGIYHRHVNQLVNGNGEGKTDADCLLGKNQFS